MRSFTCSLLSALLLSVTSTHAADLPKVIPLWPNGAPGEKVAKGEERDMTKPSDGMVGGKTVIRLGDVADPTITIYPAPKEKSSGTAVLVCPGGAYYILAMDLEGTEVCDWLNSIGVTGILLKYRVPKPPGSEMSLPALQDAQRALSLVRSQASAIGIKEDKIGVLGFSAGGHLSASLSNTYGHRAYPPVDEADEVSCRPDFTVLIYPAYLVAGKEAPHLTPGLEVTSKTPPTFMVMAEDDPVHVENVLFYALALKNAKVPFELHVYPSGGHGYGLRPSSNLVTTWPKRAEEWMRNQGYLKDRS